MKKPKFRIFKTRNNDFVIKERNCLGIWTHVFFDQEVLRRTNICSVFWDEPIYFNDFERATDLLKKHVSRKRWLRDIHDENKIEEKNRKRKQKIHFNYGE